MRNGAVYEGPLSERAERGSCSGAFYGALGEVLRSSAAREAAREGGRRDSELLVTGAATGRLHQVTLGEGSTHARTHVRPLAHWLAGRQAGSKQYR